MKQDFVIFKGLFSKFPKGTPVLFVWEYLPLSGADTLILVP